MLDLRRYSVIIRHELNSYSNIRLFAYSIIKDNILNLELKPGQKISELELVDILKIGKTPIREALIQLETENLINIFPKKGTFITKINLSKIEEGRYIRQLLEEDIHIKAMDCMMPEHINFCHTVLENHSQVDFKDLVQQFHCDEIFHKVIYEACGKSSTFQMIQTMNSDYKRYRLLATMEMAKFQKVLDEHNQILKYIEKKDKLQLKKATKKHLFQINFEKDVVINKYKQYFTY